MRSVHAPALRAIRECQGLGSRQLAEMVDIDSGFYSRIETGQRNPSADVIVRLASQLGVPVAAITCCHDHTSTGQPPEQVDLTGTELVAKAG